MVCRTRSQPYWGTLGANNWATSTVLSMSLLPVDVQEGFVEGCIGIRNGKDVQGNTGLAMVYLHSV